LTRSGSLATGQPGRCRPARKFNASVVLQTDRARAKTRKQDTITKRQDAMKGQGRSLGASRAFLEDKGELAAAPVAGAQLVQSMPTIPSMFAQKTSMADYPGKSYAKPAIWAQWDKFNADTRAATAQAEVLTPRSKAATRRRLPPLLALWRVTSPAQPTIRAAAARATNRFAKRRPELLFKGCIFSPAQQGGWYASAACPPCANRAGQSS
jgi:cytochrome c556